MQDSMGLTRDARTAERAVRLSGFVFGTSLLLLALAELLLPPGDLTVRIGLLCIGIGAAIWGRSKAAGMRDTAGGRASGDALTEQRVLVVVVAAWLLMSGIDGSPAVRGRAALLGFLGTITLYSTVRLARRPVGDAS